MADLVLSGKNLVADCLKDVVAPLRALNSHSPKAACAAPIAVWLSALPAWAHTSMMSLVSDGLMFS